MGYGYIGNRIKGFLCL